MQPFSQITSNWQSWIKTAPKHQNLTQCRTTIHKNKLQTVHQTPKSDENSNDELKKQKRENPPSKKSLSSLSPPTSGATSSKNWRTLRSRLLRAAEELLSSRSFRLPEEESLAIPLPLEAMARAEKGRFEIGGKKCEEAERTCRLREKWIVFYYELCSEPNSLSFLRYDAFFLFFFFFLYIYNIFSLFPKHFAIFLLFSLNYIFIFSCRMSV